MTKDGLPADRPLVAWYGDDFTGASAVLEALTFGGLPSVLFLDVPTSEQLRTFPGVRGIGIAGSARSQNPAWMDRELPRIFDALGGMRAAITHYKVCSTFDSSPTVGSIGRAFEIAAPILAGAWTPLLVASPPNRRFQAFGNLFAEERDVIHRIDRHPTMSRHPSTPMQEADLGRHLGRQTSQPVGLIDLVSMKQGRADAALASEIDAGRRLVSLDVIDEETLREAGRLVWEHRGERLFAVGSQGLEYALLAYWRGCGLLGPAAEPPRIQAVEQIAAVSGSCSALTAAQIAWAVKHGFRGIRLDASAAVDVSAWAGHVHRATVQALQALSEGADPIVFTALGPDDMGGDALQDAIRASGSGGAEVNARIGEGLGAVLSTVLREAKLTRGIIAGGDTSSHATAALGIYALTAVAPTVAGAALFQAHAELGRRPGIELALKGGQMGGIDYFGRIKTGSELPPVWRTPR